MDDTVGSVDVGEDDVAGGEASSVVDGNAGAIDVEGDGLASKGGDGGAVGNLLRVDIAVGDVEEENVLESLDIAKEAVQDGGGDGGEGSVGGGEDDIGAVGLREGRREAGSGDSLDKGGESGNGDGGLDDVLGGEKDVGGDKHVVNDVDDSVGGKHISLDDEGVVDVDSLGSLGDEDLLGDGGLEVEGVNELRRVEGAGSLRARCDVVVESGEEMLSVVLVGDPGDGVVSEQAKGGVGWSEDGLVTRSAEEWGDTSLSSNSNKSAEQRVGLRNLEDSAGLRLGGDEESSEDHDRSIRFQGRCTC